jgi:hypothetical protein
MAVPTKRQFSCRKCGLVLPPEVFNTTERAACPRCHNGIAARIFPAFLEGAREGHAGEAIGLAELSGCFFHPDRRAVVPCGECGRFLCALCDLEIQGRHLCPGCLEAGRQKSTLAVFRTAHTRWDNVALMIATIPLLFYFITPFTASAAIFICLWKWRSPRQAMIPYNRGRFVVALLISVITLAGWTFALYFYLNRRLR